MALARYVHGVSSVDTATMHRVLSQLATDGVLQNWQALSPAGYRLVMADGSELRPTLEETAMWVMGASTLADHVTRGGRLSSGRTATQQAHNVAPPRQPPLQRAPPPPVHVAHQGPLPPDEQIGAVGIGTGLMADNGRLILATMRREPGPVGESAFYDHNAIGRLIVASMRDLYLVLPPDSQATTMDVYSCGLVAGNTRLRGFLVLGDGSFEEEVPELAHTLSVRVLESFGTPQGLVWGRQLN